MALEGQMSIFHQRSLFLLFLTISHSKIWVSIGPIMAFLGSEGAVLVDAHGKSKAAFLVPKMPMLVLKTAISGTLIQIFQDDSLARPR